MITRNMLTVTSSILLLKDQMPRHHPVDRGFKGNRTMLKKQHPICFRSVLDYWNRPPEKRSFSRVRILCSHGPLQKLLSVLSWGTDDVHLPIGVAHMGCIPKSGSTISTGGCSDGNYRNLVFSNCCPLPKSSPGELRKNPALIGERFKTMTNQSHSGHFDTPRFVELFTSRVNNRRKALVNKLPPL